MLAQPQNIFLEQAKVSREKKRAFKGECKKMITDIYFKLQENAPLWQTIILNSSALVPSNMAYKSDNWSIRFRELADKLYALNNITAETSGSCKIQYDGLLKITKYEHRQSSIS